MCKQSGNDTTTVVQNPQVPEWLSSKFQGLADRAQTTSQTPYNPGVQRNVADFTQDQMAAFDQTRTNQGAWQPYMDVASNMTAVGGSPLSADSIQSYMDPYRQNVIDSTMANIQQNNEIQRQNMVGNIALQGGLGNDRGGIMQAELARQQNLASNQTIAGLNSQNWQQALAASNLDREAAQTGGQNFATLGSSVSNLGAADTARLAASGGVQQQLAQQQYDTTSANVQQQEQYPFATASWLGGLLQGASPTFQGYTQTQTQPGPSPLNSILGLGALGLGIFGGGGTGALGLSDERLKENERVIGTDFAGNPIYAYNEIGSPETKLGYMAQDMLETNPEAVIETPEGILMLDYDAATAPASASAEGGEMMPAEAEAPPLDGEIMPPEPQGGSFGDLPAYADGGTVQDYLAGRRDHHQYYNHANRNTAAINAAAAAAMLIPPNISKVVKVPAALGNVGLAAMNMYDAHQHGQMAERMSDGIDRWNNTGLPDRSERDGYAYGGVVSNGQYTSWGDRFSQDQMQPANVGATGPYPGSSPLSRQMSAAQNIARPAPMPKFGDKPKSSAEQTMDEARRLKSYFDSGKSLQPGINRAIGMATTETGPGGWQTSVQPEGGAGLTNFVGNTFGGSFAAGGRVPGLEPANAFGAPVGMGSFGQMPPAPGTGSFTDAPYAMQPLSAPPQPQAASIAPVNPSQLPMGQPSAAPGATPSAPMPAAPASAPSPTPAPYNRAVAEMESTAEMLGDAPAPTPGLQRSAALAGERQAMDAVGTFGGMAPRPQAPLQQGGMEPWRMGLAAAGLRMIGSRSPYPQVALGEGGLAGLGFYQQMLARQIEDRRRQEEADRLYQQFQLDQRKQRLAELTDAEERPMRLQALRNQAMPIDEKTQLETTAAIKALEMKAEALGFKRGTPEFQDAVRKMSGIDKGDATDKTRAYDRYVKDQQARGEPAKSFEQFTNDAAAAGRATTTITTSQETADAKALGEQTGKAAADVLASRGVANKRLAELGTMAALASKIDTGPLTGVVVSAAELGRQVGISPETLKSWGIDPNLAGDTQALGAAINRSVMAMIGPGGIPAQGFSNADRDFLTSAEASLKNNPRANMLLIEIAREKAQGDAARAQAFQIWRRSAENKGKDVYDFEAEYETFLNENSINRFDKFRERTEQIMQQVGPGTSVPPVLKGVMDRLGITDPDTIKQALDYVRASPTPERIDAFNRNFGGGQDLWSTLNASPRGN